MSSVMGREEIDRLCDAFDASLNVIDAR